MADFGSSLASLMQIPGLQELVNNGITQQRQNMPLRTAINQQAVNMLPNSAFGRPNMSAIPAANYSTPAPSGGGADWAKILGLLAAGAGGGALLGKLLGGGGSSPSSGSVPLGGALSKLVGLFNRNPSNPYGKTSYSNNFDPFAFDPNDPVGGGVDYGQLPGFGTPLPEANPYQNLPGYGGSWPALADPSEE